MFSRFQILSAALALGTLSSVGLSGCGAKDAVKVGNDENRGPKAPVIKKGTPTVSLVEGNAGQLKLIFEELSWSVRSADIAINKISQDEKDGCVSYKRVATGATFATSNFNCTTQIALGGTAATHKRVLRGNETYKESGARSVFINMTSSFDQSVYPIGNSSLVSYGKFTRTLKMNRPALQTQDSYGLEFASNYTGASAQESGRLGEAFELTIKGDYASSRTSGLKIPKGLKLALKFAPEREKTENTVAVYDVTATSDITYASDGSCLRPVGTFAWTRKYQGRTSQGTFNVSAVGIKVSGEAETIPWGARCLEQ